MKINFTIIDINGNRKVIEKEILDELIPIINNPPVKEIIEEKSKPIPIPKPKIKDPLPVVPKVILSPSPKVNKPNQSYRVNKNIIPKDITSFSKGFQFPFFN
jgi:hypothetical protein